MGRKEVVAVFMAGAGVESRGHVMGSFPRGACLSVKALRAEENQKIGGRNWATAPSADVFLVSVIRETLQGITRRFC